MIYQLWSVYDKKIGAFNIPMCFRSKGEAIRSFTDACSDEKGQFVRHPEDYIFAKLGEFHDDSGGIVPLDSPEFSITALDIVDREQPVAPKVVSRS